MRSTRFLSRSALSAAAAVVLLYLCCLVPSGKLALLCLSSLGTVFTGMSCSSLWGIGSCAAAAVLGVIICPDKGIPLAYAVFLGWYPLAKLALERLGKPLVRWGGKLLCFNAVFLPLFFLTKDSLLPAGGSPIWVIPAAEAAFLVYDYALKQIILFYIRKIARRIN